MSRPRMCGTAEERQAAGRVADALRAVGFETTHEEFLFRPSGDLVARCGILAGLAALALLYASAFASGWLAVEGMTWLAILAFFGPKIVRGALLSRARDGAGTPPPGWVSSSNLIARAPGPPGSPLFVFVAHYDSKSQNMPITARVFFFAVLGLAGIALAQLAVLRALTGAPGPAAFHALAAVAAAASLPLLLLTTGNASPGALDNASGVGALVELARAWNQTPLAGRARAWFVSPSAEEHGLVGSYLFVRRHEAELRAEKRLFVFNLDGVGGDGTVLLIPSGTPVTRALKQAAREEKIACRSLPTGIGLLADHVPFVLAGFPCATVIVHTAKARHVHTSRDDVDVLSDTGFDRTGKIVLRAAENLIRG